jgi:hypothetical protein
VKRLLVISLLVVVVLAMTVGTAFASTCGGSCTNAMACKGALSRTCPMGAPAALGASCAHPDQQQVREASVPQPPAGASAVSVTADHAVPTSCGPAPTLLAPDARGAPHLTSVLRI